jgi:hypothetical protein
MDNKWIWIAGTAALAITAIPMLLPQDREVRRTTDIPAPAAAVLRRLTQPDGIGSWWPGTAGPDSAWSLGSGLFRYREAYVGSVTLSARHGHLPTELSIGAAGSTTATTLTLTATTRLPANPWARLRETLAYDAVVADLDTLLARLAHRFANPDELYRFHIEKQRVEDATLVSLKQDFDHRPTTEEAYALIARVRAHIARKGARETNHPMLNIYPREGGRGLTAQVAVPTDRELPAEGPFLLKHMLPGGNILMAEVRGGSARVDSCLQALEDYVRDRNILSPAIPFQRLVTDRMAEPDSSRWVTRVYYPVF